MIELRQYQVNGVQLASEGFRNHKRQIFVLPTGGGKTVIFSDIAYKAVNKNKVVLVLTDRVELFKQASAAIGRNNVPICKINAGNKILHREAKLFVGMVETVARRLTQLVEAINPNLIIIDECHKGNFFKIIDAFPEVNVLGFTATPINKHLHKYYTNLIDVIGIDKLIEQGYLAPCRALQMEDDLSDIKKEKSGAEFNEQSMFQHYHKAKLYSGVVEEWLKECAGKQTIIFNVNIEHAETMTRAFNAAGIQSFCVTSKTKEADRVFILEQFSKGAFPVLNNCGILTTGYDEPSIQAVVVNRATMSLALWLQMVGRGGRPFPGKPYFTLLDFGMNHDRHGLWDEPRTWSIAEKKKKRNNGIGAAPVKSCKQCRAVIHLMAARCAYCGYVYPIGEMVLKEGVMNEVKAVPRIPEQLVDRFIGDFSLEELQKLQEAKQHTAQLIWRVVRSKGVEAVKQYAKMMGYKYGWVMSQTEEIEKAKAADKPIGFTNYKINQVIR